MIINCNVTYNTSLYCYTRNPVVLRLCLVSFLLVPVSAAHFSILSTSLIKNILRITDYYSHCLIWKHFNASDGIAALQMFSIWQYNIDPKKCLKGMIGVVHASEIHSNPFFLVDAYATTKWNWTSLLCVLHPCYTFSWPFFYSCISSVHWIICVMHIEKRHCSSFVQFSLFISFHS